MPTPTLEEASLPTGIGHKAANVVGSAILGRDFVTVTVAGNAYTIFPPTIHAIAGLACHLSAFSGMETLEDAIRSAKEMEEAAKALSWLISGDESLTEELSRGTLNEVADALEEGFALISAANFSRLSALARNVARLTAKPKS